MTTWLVAAYGPEMGGSGRGITRLRSRADGSLEPVEGFLIEAPSPAFLARGNGKLYAALEHDGQVLVDGQRVDSGGESPSHIAVYGDDVVVTNYIEGNVAVLGRQVLRPQPGSGPHPRQDGPRAHASAQLAPGVIAIADFGADRVDVLSLVDGVLSPLTTTPLPGGTGPRDLLVVDGVLYVLGELGLDITRAVWLDGALVLLDTVSLPDGAEGDCAAALVLGDGYVYAGLRGSNRIAVLSIEVDESLKPVASVSSAGDWPRHLAFDDGVLHVANQLSDGVASFAIGADGIPQLIAEPTFVASPNYLLRD